MKFDRDTLDRVTFWLERHFGGYVSIGRNITVFGYNAMNCAVEVRTRRWGYIVFRPTTWRYRRWRWYFYCSPNGTPGVATFAIGPGMEVEDKRLAPIRRRKLGHNFYVNDYCYADLLTEEGLHALRGPESAP